MFLKIVILENVVIGMHVENASEIEPRCLYCIEKVQSF